MKTWGPAGPKIFFWKSSTDHANFSGEKKVWRSFRVADCLSTRENNFLLQLSQVKCTPQDSINEFIIRKLNPLVVVDFTFISAFLHV